MNQKFQKETESEAKRQAYITKNQPHWREEGEWYFHLRTSLGATLEDLSMMTGFSASTINKFEWGHPVQSRKVLTRVILLALMKIAPFGVMYIQNKRPGLVEIFKILEQPMSYRLGESEYWYYKAQLGKNTTLSITKDTFGILNKCPSCGKNIHIYGNFVLSEMPPTQTTRNTQIR